MPAPVTILWFERDLRTADHAALASVEGPVVPLYVAEPEAWARPEASARQWRFVAESLAELRADLAARGAPLVVRHGEAVAALEAIRTAHPVARLASHAGPGLGWARAREARVAEWAGAHGIPWDRHRADEAQRHAPEPALLEGIDLPSGDIPEARDLGLGFDPCPGRQRGGRAEAERLLAARADGSGEATGAELEAHLAWGTISAREARGVAPSFGAISSRLAFVARAERMLDEAPELDCRCLRPALEGIRPRTADCPVIAARLGAWAGGRTGLPFLDACMRHLRATGWLDDGARGLVQGAASCHLWIDWRDWGSVLARLTTGYAPAAHWLEAQVMSGTAGMAMPRIRDPAAAGATLDPSGAFTRRWVPELAGVPDDLLQMPWRAARPPRGYPRPIVDVADAAAAARARLRAHGQGGARSRRADPRQGALDL